jgi:uncharacterized membrane protein YbaN (DUF454 family)
MAVGTLAVTLGVIGIFVPILPTTPFLLLAAFCYARSSERFYRWLLTNRWFGSYLRNYREGRGMALRDKLLTLTALWLAIGSSVAFAIASPWGKAALTLIALAVTVHLARIKTLRSPAAPRVESPEALADAVALDQD